MIPSAARAWMFILGGAIAYDLLAIHEHADTLSQWCSEHQRTTWIVGSYLLAHLVGRPRSLHNVDPLHVVAERLRRQVS